jgi:hypothetical protein
VLLGSSPVSVTRPCRRIALRQLLAAWDALRGRGPVAPVAPQGLVQGLGGVERGAQLGVLRRERRQPRRLPAGGVGAGGKALRQRRLLAGEHGLRAEAYAPFQL